MNLSQRQSRYLERRRKLLKAWRYTGPMMFLGIIGLVIYIKINSPLLINPYEVISRLESGSIKQSSLEMMAVLLPIVFIIVCFLLVVLVAIMFAASLNERKYLEIIGKTTSDDLHDSER
jgi:hypothetical protein